MKSSQNPINYGATKPFVLALSLLLTFFYRIFLILYILLGVGSHRWSTIVSLARRAMPTVHYVKREFLEENDLTIPWKINVELDIQADPSQSTGRKCAACASDLKRKSDDIIWIRVGKTDHPAYEMIRSRNNSCTTHLIDPDDMMWIEWVNTGEFEGIFKQQILKDGLQPRTRKRPNYFHDG